LIRELLKDSTPTNKEDEKVPKKKNILFRIWILNILQRLVCPPRLNSQDAAKGK
jgi:hypothetical protein